MRALVYHGPGKKSWDEVADPVTARMRYAHALTFGRPYAQPVIGGELAPLGLPLCPQRGESLIELRDVDLPLGISKPQSLLGRRLDLSPSGAFGVSLRQGDGDWHGSHKRQDRQDGKNETENPRPVHEGWHQDKPPPLRQGTAPNRLGGHLTSRSTGNHINIRPGGKDAQGQKSRLRGPSRPRGEQPDPRQLAVRSVQSGRMTWVSPPEK